MAITTIAPTEKSEHLIYAILPVSIGLALGSALTQDLFQILGITGVVSSLLTLILYEVRVDDWVVKKWYQHRSKKSQKRLEISFLSWRLFLKSWEKPTEEPPRMNRTTLNPKEDVDQLVKDVVSSSAIRKKFWPIRASVYLFLSIPFLTWMGLHNLSFIIPEIQLPFVTLVIPSDFDTQISYSISGAIAFWIVQFVLNWRRHSSLRSHLTELVKFRHVQQLVAIDAVENPDQYVSNREKANLKVELDFLDLIINRGDWNVFIGRWSVIRSNCEKLAKERLLNDGRRNLVNRWETAIQITYQQKLWNRDTSTQWERSLGWYVYLVSQYLQRLPNILPENDKRSFDYAYRLYTEDTEPLDEETKSIRQRFINILNRPTNISEPPSELLRGLLNPLYVFTSIPDELLNAQSDSTRYSSFVRESLDWLVLATKRCIDKDAWTAIQGNVSRLRNHTQSNAVQFVLDILKKCNDSKNFSGLWVLPNRCFEEDSTILLTLYELANEHGQTHVWPFALLHFLKEGPLETRTRLLGNPSWIEHLKQDPIRDYLQRVKHGDIETEDKIKEAVTKLGFLS